VKNTTVCLTDLDQGCVMIFLESILTTFIARVVFRGRWEYQNFACALNRTTISKFSLPKSVQHTVEQFYKSIKKYMSKCSIVASQTSDQLLNKHSYFLVFLKCLILKKVKLSDVKNVLNWLNPPSPTLTV
jgi:hypothetical protein